MNNNQKLERFAEREIQRNLDHMIVDDEHGGYVVFGKYYMTETQAGFALQTWDQLIHVFGSKRAALSWCVADRFKQYQLSHQILILDRKKQVLGADIHCRRSLGQRGKHESFYEIVSMKLTPKIENYTLVCAELEKCINQAKYLQIRGFNNETNRTRGA